MRIRDSFLVAGLALALSVAAGPAGAADEFSWSGRIADGKAIEIKGVNGGIVAGAASGAEVEVTARKTARHSDPDSVKIEVVEHADGVTICAVYPSREGRENVCAPGRGGRMSVRDNDVKVEFSVRVPAGVRFLGHSVNGGITAKGLKGDVDAHTVNGGVEVETAGHAEAVTVNGSIEAAVGRADWTGSARFKTVNGAITLSLPAGTNADVSAKTVNGGIDTDFPITVQGKIGRRRLEGTIGSGGRELELETVNGSIELRKR